MNTYPTPQNTPQKRGGMVLPLLAVGATTFVVGGAAMFGFTQWQAQENKLAAMSAELTEIKQQALAQAPAEALAEEIATRNVALDLLAVTTNAAAVEAAAIIPASAVAVAPTETVQPSIANQIRAIAARAADPMVSQALAQDTARRETMSLVIRGVSDFVDAAVAGDYVLDTTSQDNGTSGKLQISFVGREDDQEDLEKLLASAAEAGMVAFNESVVGSDGSIDGEILLFDLVERALANGTLEERDVSEQIRQDAINLLVSENALEVAPESTADERFYVVESGDSLAYIALQFYGNTNAYSAIYEANRDQLTTPDKIQIGQRLRIPNV